MSRCFPFPPPGYEKRARIDDTDFLKKERRREKKHKKDKEKERKKDKEKKSKDGSKEKQKERKVDKENKKNKKKKKKDWSLGKKRATGQSELRDGEKLDPDGRSKSCKPNDSDCDFFVREFARRIHDEEGSGASGSQSQQQSSATVLVSNDQRKSGKIEGNSAAEFRIKKHDQNRKLSENMEKEGGIMEASTMPLESAAKELGVNGCLADGGVEEHRPNKILRKMVLLGKPTFLENGRKPASQEDPMHNHGLDDVENGQHQINGVMAPEKLDAFRMAPSVNGEASQKPRHRDVKYLSRILMVPKKSGDLPDSDGQEWLLGCNHHKVKNFDGPSSSAKAKVAQQVWAEAVLLESVGISALPYVIPY